MAILIHQSRNEHWIIEVGEHFGQPDRTDIRDKSLWVGAASVYLEKRPRASSRNHEMRVFKAVGGDDPIGDCLEFVTEILHPDLDDGTPWVGTGTGAGVV